MLQGYFLGMKIKAPENSLGTYLTKKDIGSIEIYSQAGISKSEISKLRSGRISTISAQKLYLISLVTKEDIQIILPQVYPNLRLNLVDKSTEPIDKCTFTPLGVVLDFLPSENNSLVFISLRTGIKMPRLKDLIKKDSTIVLAHELYLLELATSVEPGSYFRKLYSNLKLKS